MHCKILCFLLCPFILSAQESTDTDSTAQTHFHFIKYSFKTNSLTLINSLLNPEDIEINLSSEFNYNKGYGLQMDISYEKFSNINYSGDGVILGLAFKNYFHTNDYTGLFAGLSGSVEHAIVKIKSGNPETFPEKKQKLVLNGSLAGGYVLLFGKHFLLTPEASVGVRHFIKPEDGFFLSTFPSSRTGLDILVRLYLGYRF